MKKNYLLLLFIMLSLSALAQSPIKGTWGIDGYISTIASDNNYTYIGGLFDYCGPNTGSGVKISVTNVHPDLNFPVVNGKVGVVISDGKGGWYLGGSFTKVGKYERNGFAQITADGTVTPWNPGSDKKLGKNGGVTAMAVDDSAVYIAGYFSPQDGVTKYLFKTDKVTGKVDDTWNPAPDKAVLCLALNNDFLYAGGRFEKIGGKHRAFVARLDKTKGNLDTVWYPIPDHPVHAIVLSGHSVYIGGEFTSLWSVGAAWYAAKLNDTNGAPINPFWKPYPDGYVDKIALDGNEVILAGQFHHILRDPDTTIKRTFLASFGNNVGKVNRFWDPEPDGLINDVKVKDNGIYVSGDFENIGKSETRYIARLDNVHGYGLVDNSWAPKTDGPVYQMAFNGNNLYVGGNFRSFGGVMRKNILRFKNSDLTLDMHWNPEAGDVVSSIVPDNDSVYLAGGFITVGKYYCRYLAKVSAASGLPDTNWKYGPHAPVRDMTMEGDNLFVCGYFTKVGNGVGSDHFHTLAKINKHTGFPDLSWTPDPTGGLPNGEINKIIANGPYVYATGRFYNNDRTQIRYYLKRISIKNGKEDPQWDAHPGGLVWDMKIKNNVLYAAGDFTHMGGRPHHGLAKINLKTGKIIDKWSPNAEGGIVKSLAISNDYLYAGGNFKSIDGNPVKLLARFPLCAGIADLSWQPVLTEKGIFEPDINALHYAANRLVTGGWFNFVNDTLYNHFVVYREPEHPETVKTVALAQGSYSYHSMAIRSDGKVYAWGNNIKGQLGNNDTTDSNVPVPVDSQGVLSGKKIVEAAMGYRFSLVLSDDGKVYSFGENEFGQLGNNSDKNSKVPVAVDTTGVLSGKTITTIAAGGAFALALDTKGKVYSWGFGSHGELGIRNTFKKTVPVAVDTTKALAGKKIVAIAAGTNYGVAVDSQGMVYTWGENDKGQLGINSTKHSEVPVPIYISRAIWGKTIVAVAAGIDHTLALSSDGKVYAWGDNSYGQLGNHSFDNSTVPVVVDTTGVLAGKKVIAIAAGANYSMALTSDGKIYAWGSNNSGQLGVLGLTRSNVPVAVNLTGSIAGKIITAIAAGIDHSLALTCDGKVYAWGNNSYGQLGNHSFTGSTSPVEVIWQMATPVEEIHAEKPGEVLLQNFPNPVISTTTIRYTIPETFVQSATNPQVTLKVYDAFGRVISVLVNKPQAPGKHTVTCNGSGWPKGIYFYRLQINGRSFTGKMVVEK